MLQFIVLVTCAQCYVARTASVVNMREGPSTEYGVVKCLNKNTVIYVDLDDAIDDWYLVVDIQSNKEGYVSSKYVKLQKTISKSSTASIQRLTRTHEYNPSLHIKNQTGKTLLLRINSTSYNLSIGENLKVTVEPGKFRFRASAVGVVPLSGEYTTESNYEYDWRFYIK